MRRLCFMFLVGIIILGIVGIASAIPQFINYQGFLADSAGAPVPDGNYSLVFRIWNAETGGSQLWSEDHSAVDVTNGLCNVVLGSVSPLTLPFDTDYWLGIEIEGAPELPRIQLTSVGYSYRAGWADTAAYSVRAPRDDDWTPDTEGVNIFRLIGNVGIGTPSPESELEVAGTSDPTIQVTDSDNSVKTGIQSWSGGGWIGTLTNHPLRVATNGTYRMVIDTSGNVGIGTASPSTKLHIGGGGQTPTQAYDGVYVNPASPQVWISVEDTTGVEGGIISHQNGNFYIGSWSNNPVRLRTNNVDRVTIDILGNVGIGTSPSYKLDVAGDIHCTGKLTSDGGNDPPYVLYNRETRESIKERVAKEVPEDKLDGAILFWNGEELRFEVYLPARGEFRDIQGNLLAKEPQRHARK